MRRRTPSARPRRGAWRGSRQATAAAAAACLATIAIALLAPGQARAYPCGAPTAATAPAKAVPVAPAVSADDCPVPETLRHPRRERTSKKGSMSGLTVFVLAVAGALLIPIGRNGMPNLGDPFGHDRPF